MYFIRNLVYHIFLLSALRYIYIVLRWNGTDERDFVINKSDHGHTRDDNYGNACFTDYNDLLFLTCLFLLSAEWIVVTLLFHWLTD